MPSLFNLSSSKRKNPYSNPHHPSHNPLPKGPPAASTTPQPLGHSHLPPRAASPRASPDFLAEARTLARRDPVTGRPLYPEQPVYRPDAAAAANRRIQPASPAPPPPAPPQQETRSSGTNMNAEMSAYRNRASLTRPTMGSRYDLFAEECKRVRREEERAVKARGGVEYYAPERQIGEFYAGPVRD